MFFNFVQYWEKYRERFTLIIAILFSFLLMAADHSPPILFIKNVIGSCMGRIQESTSHIPHLLSLQQKNYLLLERLGQLAGERDQYHEALLENQRLRKLLGFKERHKIEYIPARVIGMGTIGLPGTVHLNVGYQDKCEKNMVMVTHKGLVGKLISVSKNTSVGQLLTDPNFRISAKIQRSRVLGVVRWLYGNICTVDGVVQRSDVRAGDLVVTSGYSQIYPPGLRIGKVFEVVHEKNTLFLRVLLKSEVDFSTLEEVLILKDTNSS